MTANKLRKWNALKPGDLIQVAFPYRLGYKHTAIVLNCYTYADRIDVLCCDGLYFAFRQDVRKFWCCQ
jgi:hypothetical protein